MDSQLTARSRATKQLIQFLNQQPDQARENSSKGGKHERGPTRLLHFEFRPRNVVVNVAALVKFHQHERDDETHCGPLETSQSKIKHPEISLTAESTPSTDHFCALDVECSKRTIQPRFVQNERFDDRPQSAADRYASAHRRQCTAGNDPRVGKKTRREVAGRPRSTNCGRTCK